MNLRTDIFQHVKHCMIVWTGIALALRLCARHKRARRDRRHIRNRPWRAEKNSPHVRCEVSAPSRSPVDLKQTEPIVFVIDDDASMRDALGALIASDGLRVVCFESAQEFLRHSAPDTLPSCLVLDVRMPGVGGLELQRKLVESGRQIPVVFITAHADIPTAVRAMKAGAMEFLPKPFRSDELLSAIRQALERDRKAVEQRTRLGLIRERRDRLTDRERQVMARIARGRLNKQIAAELGVSENTIKAHRHHIMKKMGAASFADLVLMIERLA
jgi:FixJ family two-component response regulator